MTWDPLWLSVQIATIAMVVSLVVGTGLALLTRWNRVPARDALDAVISAPLILPPTVLGYYLLVALGPGSLVGRAWHAVTGGEIAFTFSGAVIAASVGSLPLVVRSVRVGLDSVEPNLLAAARTLGAAPLRVLATVTLPLAAPGLIAGAMLGFARALGDYGMTQMIAGARIDGLGIDRTPTASIYVYDQIQNTGNEAAARDMAIAMTVVGVAILYLTNKLTRRYYHRV
jgi:molybdate transport system permease protein